MTTRTDIATHIVARIIWRAYLTSLDVPEDQIDDISHPEWTLDAAQTINLGTDAALQFLKQQRP